MALFICVEGIDGAGKTTTAAKLASLLTAAGHDIVLIRKGSIDIDHPEFAAGLGAIGRGRWNAFLEEATIALGELAWILYNASYYAALDGALISPALRRGQWVIIDGWFYKFAVRAGYIGTRSTAHVLSLFGEVREPDRTFLLDVPPEVAAERLRTFSESEIGNGSGGDIDRTRAFLGFQTEMAKSLRMLAEQKDWTVLERCTESADSLGMRLAGLLESESSVIGN